MVGAGDAGRRAERGMAAKGVWYGMLQLWDDIMPSEKTDLKEERCVIRLRFLLKSFRMLGCPLNGTKDLDLGSWC